MFVRIVQLLLLAALIWIAWRVLRNAFGPREPTVERPEFEPMARCARCGTHVPRGELDAAGVCRKCLSQG